MSIPFLGNTLDVKNILYVGFPSPNVEISWYRDQELIQGVTGTQYVVSPEDVGFNLSVKIDLENLYGVTSSTLLTNVVQSNAQPPSILSEPYIDSQFLPPVSGIPVYIEDVNISGIPTPSVSYTWYVDGVEVQDGFQSTYRPTENDEGKQISAKITATNILDSVFAYTNETDLVRPNELNGSYVNIVGPVYAGYTAKIMTDLYGATTTIYNWQVDSGGGFESFGSNEDSVSIPSEYLGFDIKCTVTASDDEGNTLLLESNVVEVLEATGVILSSYDPQGVLIPGDGYQTEFTEKSTERVTNSPDVFASESHPVFHLGFPLIHHMDSDGFTLDMYAFHGSSIKNVLLSCDGGTEVTAGFVQEGGYTGAGYFYFPIDSSNFVSGATYEIRATAIPINGYPRSKQMILTYYGGEKKVQIDTNTSIKEACLQITSAEDYDPTNHNIIELTESGYYDFGSNVSGSFPTDSGVLEVVPATGVDARFDFTTQSRTPQGWLRPGLKQMKFKNIIFENKIGPAADNPNNSNPGVYIEDSSVTRWYFEGCTMQGDWYDSGNWLLSCEEAPNREGWFRNAYDQTLCFIDCYAEQCHNSPFGADLSKNCVVKYNHQDSYTNAVACINCSSIDHLTPTCSAFHADHYQLFSPRDPYLVENHLLYGYYGNDLVENNQPFGFFGTGNETYRDIAHVMCRWDGASGSPALAQIGLTYDHVLFIGITLENRGFAFVDRPGNAVGPVLVRGVRESSPSVAFLHELEYLALVGTTNEFRVEDNDPEVRFTGIPSDDSALSVIYEWHIPGASMESVNNFNMYLLDGTGQNESWHIGVTANGSEGPESIANIFNSNPGSGRFAYCNFRYPDGDYFRNISLTNVIDENAAIDLENKDYYIRMITSSGTSTSLAGKKRTTNNQVDFSGFSPSVFGGIDQTADDILNSPTGVTFQVLSPI